MLKKIVGQIYLIALVTIFGCHDSERSHVDDRHAPLAQPSAATLENCHAMYPKQPDIEQECIKRWTVGDQMSGLPSGPPRGTGLTSDISAALPTAWVR